ncbi:MAG TPA: NrfD/PsrC family molybdoenzyme membrane anchor subunit [Anaerolineales bacterium]|nr:NrfD/PsrC family molybdoenzyme membrane anchor subunit [Anaerolineales bacterium]
MMIKKILYTLGALALLFGLYGFYIRLFVGERDVSYGSYVTWGLWVAMYLFFAGIATGAYMLATLDYLFEISLFKGTGKYALWGAIVTMPAALMTIGMDLGHMERIWKVYLQPNFFSLLAQMVWGYSIFLVVTLISLWFAIQNRRDLAMKALMVVGLFLAVFLSGGVGALLGINANRAYWHVGLLPAQFPVFSLASGMAFMLIVVGWFGIVDEARRSQLLWIVGLLSVVLGLVKVYFLWADFSQSLYSGLPDNVKAVQLVLFGPYAWAFWGLQIVLGTLVPIIVLVQPKLAKNGLWAGLMGVFILVGFAVARANIVFPALAVPELEGLIAAFTGPHLNIDYFPSLLEWSVTFGVVGLATLAYILGIDRLPFFSAKTEVTK